MRPSPTDHAELHHRALSDRTRRRLLELLRASGSGSDAHHLAAELDRHVNTVRSHLAILERAGLVTSSPEERRIRGRPRIIYRAVGDADATGSVDGYRFLASVLASSLADDAPDPGDLAERAGERWGHHLGGRRRPGSPATTPDAVERARSLFEELGFAPRVDPARPRRLVLHHCPFRDLALEHTDVVCGVHLGVLRGALADAGAPTDAVTLSPFVTDGTCVADLGPA